MSPGWGCFMLCLAQSPNFSATGWKTWTKTVKADKWPHVGLTQIGDYHIGNRNILLWSHRSPRLVMFLTILLPDPLLSLSHGAAPTSVPKTSIPLLKKWCELAHSFLLSKQAPQGSGHNTKSAGGQEVFREPSQTHGHTGTLDTHLQRGKTGLRMLPGCQWGD